MLYVLAREELEYPGDGASRLRRELLVCTLLGVGQLIGALDFSRRTAGNLSVAGCCSLLAIRRSVGSYWKARKERSTHTEQDAWTPRKP